MGDVIMVAIAALVAAAMGAGFGRAAGASIGGSVPGGGSAVVAVLDRDTALRRFLVAVAREALDGFGSDKWHQVTQGRKGATYSNCGDLCHAVLWWAGCRDPNVNRQSDGRQWISGNIAKLRAVFEARKAWTWFPTPTAFQPGDMILIGDHAAGELEHVAVVLATDGTTFTSADYGQAGQGGSERTRRYTLSGGKWRSDDGRRLVARGNVSALAYAFEPDPPTVVRTPAVNAATAALAASRGANA